MGESRNAYRVLVGRPEEKRPLGRQRRRWEDDINMDLREIGYDGIHWINLAQDRQSIYIDVRFELTTSVPQERRSRGARRNGARRRGERANAAREWSESARAIAAYAVNGERTFPTLREVRRSGDIQIILYTPVEISRNYDFAIKEEAPANSSSFSVIQSVSKPE
ncbi:hypothetical protein ANN_03799 [Periplaneta americana]|uniref:Uncharacterized protein n=1 Tax=Periplaneta americana TaxID=6978 RepID=A0ABQ8U399_PERAM|nr:hypothetical protein ANN_03799 [Periplaneta americana]